MTSHPLFALSERYLRENTFSKSTIKSYQIAFKHYIAYLVKHDIHYATTRDVIAFRESKRNLGHSPYYLYVYMCALRGLYRYLLYNVKHLSLPTPYSQDIMKPIKNERIKPNVNKPILTLDQTRQLLNKTQENKKAFWDYRNYAIIYLMLTSGLSPHDILVAKKADYTVNEGKPVLWVNAHRKDDTQIPIPLSHHASQALEAYLAKRNDTNPYLFITRKNTGKTHHLSRTFFQTMFRRVLEDAGLDGLGLTPHCLRHTAAVLNLLRGGSIEETKVMMRHASIDSTMIYYTYVEQIKRKSEEHIESFILKESITDYITWLDTLAL